MFNLSTSSSASTNGSLVDNVHGGILWPNSPHPTLSLDDIEWLREADPGFPLGNSSALHSFSSSITSILLGQTSLVCPSLPTYPDTHTSSECTVESIRQTPRRHTGRLDSKSRVEVQEIGFLTSSEDSPFSTISITPPHELKTTYGDLSVEARRIGTHGTVCSPSQHGWTLSPVLSTPSLSSSPYSPYVPSPTSLTSSKSSPKSSSSAFTGLPLTSPLRFDGVQSTTKANLGHTLSYSQHGPIAVSPYIYQSVTADSSFPMQPCTSHPIPHNYPEEYASPRVPSISPPFGAQPPSLSTSAFHIKKTAARNIQVDAAHIPLVPGSSECPVQGCGFYLQDPNRRSDLRKHVKSHTREYNSARHGFKWACRGITVEEAVRRGEDISTAKPWGDMLRVGGCGSAFSNKFNYQRHMNSKSCLRSEIPSA